ncbi:Ger(x)C family spore germination C-terminal domain-containing protein [Neobacillus niacini]|uniref:Ger(x)C family spore germination C-terminal domain-containing protein n=1 Tax=Neobacillus niacini TaxID=86668 RepID=UPI0027D7912C|nr:Ger(x)C family spore germination C-terminal domain-containing protein [Neobacillus niacini]
MYYVNKVETKKYYSITTDVKIKKRKGPPKIDVKVPIEIELLSVPSMIDYAGDLKRQKILKNWIANEIEKKMVPLIEKTKKEYKSEPFYWSLYVRPLFNSTKEYEEWDWANKNYPFSDIDVNVQVEIIGFGKQMKESEMEKVRD